MVKANLKCFYRRALKNKFHFFLNLSGLTVGITSAIMIFLWVRYETSYDKYLPDADHVFRMYSDIKMNGNDFTSSMAPPPLASVISAAVPEIISCTRIWTYSNITVSKSNNGIMEHAFNEKHLIQADSNFFEVFQYKLLQGDTRTALLYPMTIVLTHKAAIRYFGKKAFNENKILGNTLTITFGGWNAECRITGITEDVPTNTHMPFDIIFSNVTDPWSKSTIWVDNTYYTYMRLREGVDPQVIELKIPAIVKSHLDPQLQTSFSTSYDQLRAKGNRWDYKLQALKDIHLYSSFEREITTNGNITQVYILSISAFFLLLIACINYTNLSTASSIKRSKEVGIKKTFGVSKTTLRIQFFTESIFISFIALLLAIGLTLVLLVPFSNLMQVEFPQGFFFNGFTGSLVTIVFVVVAFLGGVYPSLYISSFKPITALKGKIQVSNGFLSFRKALILSQLCISIGLVICALVVYRQLNYLQKAELGFNKENVIVISDPSQKLGDKTNTFYLRSQAKFFHH